MTATYQNDFGCYQVATLDDEIAEIDTKLEERPRKDEILATKLDDLKTEIEKYKKS